MRFAAFTLCIAGPIMLLDCTLDLDRFSIRTAAVGGGGNGVTSSTSATGASGATTSGATTTGGGGGSSPCNYADVVMSTDGLVGYWRLGEGSTGLVARDEVADRNGTYQPGVSVGRPSLIPNCQDTSISIDTNSGEVSLSDVFDFDGDDSFTIEAWIDVATNMGHQGPFVGKLNGMPGSPAHGWSLNFSNDDKIKFSRYRNTATVTASSNGLDDGTYHVVAVHERGDPSEMRVYVNGAQPQQATSDINLLNTSAPLIFGGINFKGGLDDVSIYDRALTQMDVEAHYAAGMAPPSP
jgi:hypothetical protein